MPTYDYICAKCSTKFELRRSISARDDEAPCPKCKSKSTARKQVNRLNILTGVRPIAALGEGEAEDFLDDAEDHFDDGMGGGHGHSHGAGDHSHNMGGDHGGVNNWDGDVL